MELNTIGHIKSAIGPVSDGELILDASLRPISSIKRYWIAIDDGDGRIVYVADPESKTEMQDFWREYENKFAHTTQEVWLIDYHSMEYNGREDQLDSDSIRITPITGPQ